MPSPTGNHLNVAHEFIWASIPSFLESMISRVQSSSINPSIHNFSNSSSARSGSSCTPLNVNLCMYHQSADGRYQQNTSHRVKRVHTTAATPIGKSPSSSSASTPLGQQGHRDREPLEEMYASALEYARARKFDEARGKFMALTGLFPHACKCWVSWAQVNDC